MDNRIRILHIIGGLGAAGTERQLFLTIKYLDSTRFVHHILVLNPDQNQLQPQCEKLGANIWLLPRTKKNRWSRLLYIMALTRFLQVDVIHSWTFYANFYAGLGGLLSKVRLRIGSHRSADVHYKFLPLLYRRMTTDTLNCLTVNSLATVNQLIQTGFSRDRLMYLPNIVEYPPPKSENLILDLPGIKKDSRLVGTVGNLHQAKNHEMFIESVAKLVEQWKIQGVIIGRPVDGELDVLPRIMKKIQELGLQEYVIYGGYCPDALRMMNQFYIFCLTSDYEGMPNVVLEAMAAGRPIVATRVGGVPDVVQDGVNGYLVEPGDSTGLSHAIERILKEPELAQQMGEISKKIVQERHSPLAVIQNYETLYQLSWLR